MAFLTFLKKFFFLTLKEIYSFFLKLLLFIFLIFTITTCTLKVATKNKKPKNYSYIFFNPVSVSEDKIENSLLADTKYNVSFTDMILAMDTMKDDKSVKGIIINLDNIDLSTTNIEEIKNSFEEFKKSNKKIYAYGAYITNYNYPVAALASEIIMVPSESSSFSLTGYHYTRPYYKSLLDKIGVDIDVIHIGDFKSYGEEYYNTEMSNELKSELTRIYDIRFNNFLTDISKARNIDQNKLKTGILDGDDFFLSPFNARDKNLIDKIEHSNQFFSRLNIKEDDIADIYTYIQEKNILKSQNKNNKIAIIYLEGPINYNPMRPDEISITPENVNQKIDEALKTKDLKGIVLRINSPGGSALASEIIYSALSDAKANVPIYVSMGSTAASGGYYIAMAGDKIFANKSTITGSIGVVTMVPKISKAADKIGVSSTSITNGKYSDIFDPFTSLSDESRNKIRDNMTNTYDEFKSRVVKNRKISNDQLEQLAQGRIWTGEEAKQNKLIDEIGTLDDTIDTLAKDLNIDEYDIVHVYSKEAFSNIFEKLLYRFNINMKANFVPSIMEDYDFLQNNAYKSLYYSPLDIDRKKDFFNN